MPQTRSAFNEQQQFHLLIGLQDSEQQITVLPGLNRCFLIIDQGLILGELGFDRLFNCISNGTRLQIPVLKQVLAQIRQHCRLAR